MGMNVNLGGGAAEGDEIAEDQVVAEINITPLTDVFLVLLIIFMVSTTAMVDSETSSRSGVKVALPKSNASGPVSNRKTIPIVSMTADNRLFLFNKEVKKENLETELRKALADADTNTVFLRGDKSALLGPTVDLMSIARKAGAANITFLTSGDGK